MRGTHAVLGGGERRRRRMWEDTDRMVLLLSMPLETGRMTTPGDRTNERRARQPDHESFICPIISTSGLRSKSNISEGTWCPLHCMGRAVYGHRGRRQDELRKRAASERTPNIFPKRIERHLCNADQTLPRQLAFFFFFFLLDVPAGKI